MPDTTIPAQTTQVTQDIQEAIKSTQDLNASMNSLNVITDSAKDVLAKLGNSLQAAGIDLERTAELTAHQAKAFSLLTDAALGASNAFDSFSNIDTTGLNTFGSQFTDVINIIGTGKGAIAQLSQFALDKFNTIIPNSLKGNVSSVKQFVLGLAESFVKSADNGIKLQNAFLQMSARTGDFGTVIKLAGPQLQNMNSLLSMQSKLLSDSASATQLPTRTIVDYYSQLGKVPGSLSAIVQQSSNSAQSTSMLTAAIQVATGSGRKFSEVVDDLQKAFAAYGLSGQPALQFSAQIADLSQKNALQLEDVKNALYSGADAFKLYGASGEQASRMLEGAAKIMNNYVSGLKASGLSGTEAAATVANMTNQLSKLSLAQKGFLSAQTGGPGGLMGAFQIEKLMKEGKIDEVMEKVRESFKKQFGKIATLEDATSSPQGAAQLTRQMMMLQQGPLGAFAKNDQESLRILEAMKAKDEGRSMPANLDLGKSLQNTMDIGTKFQETSATELSRIRGLLEATQLASIVPKIGLMQQGIGFRSGTSSYADTNTATQREAMINRREFARSSMTAGGRTAQTYIDAKKTGNVKDLTGVHFAENMKDYGKFFQQLSTSVNATIDEVKGVFTSISDHSTEMKNKWKENLNNTAKNLREQAESEKDQAKKQIFMSNAQAVEDLSKQIGIFDNALMSKSVGSEIKSKGNISPGKNVGIAAQGAVEQGSETNNSGTNASQKQSASKVDVHVTGYCIKCKSEIDKDHSHANTVTTGAQ